MNLQLRQKGGVSWKVQFRYSFGIPNQCQIDDDPKCSQKFSSQVFSHQKQVLLSSVNLSALYWWIKHQAAKFLEEGHLSERKLLASSQGKSSFLFLKSKDLIPQPYYQQSKSLLTNLADSNSFKFSMVIVNSIRSPVTIFSTMFQTTSTELKEEDCQCL